MKNVKQLAITLAMSSLVFISCDKDDDDYDNGPSQPAIQSTVVKIAGDSATIVTKLDEFRAIVGDPVNQAPGQTTGRREVNWDGVPSAFTNNNTFPLDFFNSTDPAVGNGRKRGLQYPANGTLIRLDSSDFVDLDASYAAQFEPFSRRKLITPVNTNILEVIFKIPGTATDASVKGFGVIFTDVDNSNSTSVEFFNGSKSLGVFKAPAAAGAGKYSFLGVHFPVEKITRLKIITGDGALAGGIKDVTDGGGKDLVAVDDFLYSEPIGL